MTTEILRKVGRIAIKSPVYGSLTLLYAEDGARLDAGDKVCEIEVMKVFYPVETSHAGILSWSAKLGRLVGEGEILAWIQLKD